MASNSSINMPANFTKAGSGSALGAESYETSFADISSLATRLNELHQQSAQACAPIVGHLIRTGTRDCQRIEHMLDRLLDCACHPDGLQLFKSLCRYYYGINPTATANYVGYYRQMWDDDTEATGE